MTPEASSPPLARRVPKELTTHGHTRLDDYFWLRDRADPAVIDYLEAENAYTAAAMHPTEALQNQLYEEILGRIKEDDVSAPVKHGEYFYYSRTEKGKAYTIHCRKHLSLEAPEEITLDANVLAQGHSYFRIGASTVSPDHTLLAYSVDLAGDETFTLRVKDLRTGTLLPDEIVNTYYSVEWANDNRTLFYTVLDEAKRPFRVYRHELGATEDALVYEEADARFEVELLKTRSRAFVLVMIDSPLTSEVLAIRADDPRGDLRMVQARQPGVEFDVEHQGEWFYIRTNEGAQNFRVVRTPAANPSPEHQEEIIPGSDRRTVEDVNAFRGFLVLSERENGLETLHVTRADDRWQWQPIPFQEPVYSVGVVANPEYDTNQVRFTYTSLVMPTSVYDYNMETAERILVKQQEVLGGYDPSQYVSERLHARAPDGVEIPISLVYRKGNEPGPRPMLLYGYGAYGLTTDPVFGSDRLSLLDRGYTFAVAHVRGSGDLGKFWHDAGKLLNKRNTFTDFTACAEYLIGAGITASDRLAILGGSAGGLLMGAVVNLRPDLFRAVVTRVPFVDVVSTMLDPTIPLTITEYEEWGNPEEADYYRYLLGYSPYDQVEAKDYPAMLVRAGLNDPRVAYWEPAKWVAKLRALKTGDSVLLLKTNMGAGHFGPSGRYAALREQAFDYAFLLHFGAKPAGNAAVPVARA